MPTEYVNNGDTYVILLEQMSASAEETKPDMDILSHK
jgi:hypothetical protein